MCHAGRRPAQEPFQGGWEKRKKNSQSGFDDLCVRNYVPRKNTFVATLGDKNSMAAPPWFLLPSSTSAPVTEMRIRIRNLSKRGEHQRDTRWTS